MFVIILFVVLIVVNIVMYVINNVTIRMPINTITTVDTAPIMMSTDLVRYQMMSKKKSYIHYVGRVI